MKLTIFNAVILGIISIALPLLAELNANWLNGLITGMSLTMFALLTIALFEGDL